jgi:hypothetical protein
MEAGNPLTRALRGPAFRDARMFVRRLQGPRRALPDFLIVGAQKSGTTSLHRWLEAHPAVRGGTLKEVHFFDGGLDPAVDTFALGANWYRAHFPLRGELAPGQKVFEASPSYLFHPLAPARIAALLPETRLVAILRNPTDRAISHYFHNVRPNRGGLEPLPVAEAMAAEEARLAPALARGDWKDPDLRAFSYKARGRYLEQLERYRARFPADRLLVLRAEDLFEDPAGLMRRLYAFLGLEMPRGGDFRPVHVGGNREAVDPGVRAELDAYFAPHNRALAAALGQDFGW